MAVLPPDPVYLLRNVNMGAVNSLCFYNSDKLFAGTLKGSIYLWDLETNRSILQLNTESEQPILSIIHSLDSLVTQEKGNTIKIWTLSNSGYELSNELKSEHLGFCRMEHLPDKNSILNPKNENEISLYELSTLSLQLSLMPTDSNLGSIMCIKHINFSGQTYILAVYESGDFLTWDLRCSKVINREKLEVEGPFSIDYDSVTNRGVYGGSTDNIGVFSYDKSTMQIIKKTDIKIKNSGIGCVKIRSDRKVFTTGGSDGRLRIFSWKSLRPLAVLTDHKDSIMDIAYSKEQVSLYKAPIMAGAGKDGQISLWALYN